MAKVRLDSIVVCEKCGCLYDKEYCKTNSNGNLIMCPVCDTEN